MNRSRTRRLLPHAAIGVTAPSGTGGARLARAIATAALPLFLSCGGGRLPSGSGPADDVSVPQVVRDAAPGVADATPAASLAPSTPPKAPAAPPELPKVGELLHGAALAPFFEAMAFVEREKSSRARVLVFGDSHTAADGWTSVLRSALQSRMGDAGRGFVPLGRPWKSFGYPGVRGGMSQGFAVVRRSRESDPDGLPSGLLGLAIESRKSGAFASTEVDDAVSTLSLQFATQPAGGSFDLWVDGAKTTRITTRGESGARAAFNLDMDERAHRIEARIVGDGPVRLLGLTAERKKHGVVVDTLGVNGARATDLVAGREAWLRADVAAREPALLVLAFGTNESMERAAKQAYRERLVAAIERIKRAAPKAACLLVGPPDRAEKRSGEWVSADALWEVVDVQREVAKEKSCAYYDVAAKMGGRGSMAAWAAEDKPRGGRDRVHLSPRGYRAIGGYLGDDLLKAYDLWRALAGMVGR